MARALQLMSETPLIDGHNDLPWQLRKQLNNQLNRVDLNTLATTHTNIPKIKAGRLGAEQLIVEMNRLGMLIDLAHVTVEVMNQVLDTSKVPVIFSHSSAYAVCPNKRNVPDDILRRVEETQGIVMVNFYSEYVSCSKTAKLSDVADHFDHIKKVAGASIIGFGGDYDGVNGVPEDLEDVSKFPSLVAELLRRGWTD